MALSNQWFGIADAGLILRATTTDDTSTAWAANAPKELAISKVAAATASTYTVAATSTGDTSAQLYLVCMVKAATPPTLAAQSITVGASALTPSMGNSTESSISTPDVTDGTVTYAFAATTGAAWPFAYVIGT